MDAPHPVVHEWLEAPYHWGSRPMLWENVGPEMPVSTESQKDPSRFFRYYHTLSQRPQDILDDDLKHNQYAQLGHDPEFQFLIEDYQTRYQAQSGNTETDGWTSVGKKESNLVDLRSSELKNVLLNPVSRRYACHLMFMDLIDFTDQMSMTYPCFTWRRNGPATEHLPLLNPLFKTAWYHFCFQYTSRTKKEKRTTKYRIQIPSPTPPSFEGTSDQTLHRWYKPWQGTHHEKLDQLQQIQTQAEELMTRMELDLEVVWDELWTQLEDDSPILQDLLPHHRSNWIATARACSPAYRRCQQTYQMIERLLALWDPEPESDYTAPSPPEILTEGDWMATDDGEMVFEGDELEEEVQLDNLF